MIYAGKFTVTSPFGWRMLNGKSENHKGIDVVGLDSKRICAVRGGVVGASQIITDKSNRTWEWGNYIRIDGDDGMKYYYCHLSERLVSVGQRVHRGDHIGIEGNTGYSFGSHCHFEVRNYSGWSVDPSPYLAIPNAVGQHGADWRTLVQKRFGLSDSTMLYLDGHPYASDLYMKLGECE